ncbi:MAG: DUF2318 domain-containing protein [Clostridiales bacterium]|nr:DUF2318 domain-containing protein [Clostridiales bacterium]
MKQLTCEMCGGTDLIKQDGVFVCQNCGMKYSVEDAKKMMIEGTVDVQGTVKVDNSAFVEKYLQNARRALNKEDWEEVEKYYNMVESNAPNNMEAVFFSSYGKAMLSMTDNDYFKREQKIGVLVRSMSVISDCYESTTENKEDVLRKIGTYIEKMYNITFVYQRQEASLVGAVSALSGVTGSKQWCINLFNSVKLAFLTELKQIAQKHDDTYIQELINKYDVVQPQAVKPKKLDPTQPAAETKRHTGLGALIGFVLGVLILLAISGGSVDTLFHLLSTAFGTVVLVVSCFVFIGAVLGACIRTKKKK